MSLVGAITAHTPFLTSSHNRPSTSATVVHNSIPMTRSSRNLIQSGPADKFTMALLTPVASVIGQVLNKLVPDSAASTRHTVGNRPLNFTA